MYILNKIKDIEKEEYIINIYQEYKERVVRLKAHFQKGKYDVHKDMSHSFDIKIISPKTIEIKWKKYTPSGYGDNGIGGTFEIELSKDQIDQIIKNGFTINVVSKFSNLIRKIQNEVLVKKYASDD
jgi:hypothetical protein